MLSYVRRTGPGPTGSARRSSGWLFRSSPIAPTLTRTVSCGSKSGPRQDHRPAVPGLCPVGSRQAACGTSLTAATRQPGAAPAAHRRADPRCQAGGPFAAVAPVDLSGLERERADRRAAGSRSTVRRARPSRRPPVRGSPESDQPGHLERGHAERRFTGRSTELEDLRIQILGGSQADVPRRPCTGWAVWGRRRSPWSTRIASRPTMTWYGGSPPSSPDLISTSFAELAAGSVTRSGTA